MVEKKYPKRYTAGLSKEDKKKQKKQLDKSTSDYKKGKLTDRKKLDSYKPKKSKYVESVKEKTGLPINIDKLADKFSRSEKRKKQLLKGMEEIIDKGKGAYYSSGSRPNQTPDSWGKARLASVLVGGPSRKIDKKIVDKYDIPKI
jgi:hypothetical protein|tara:strand:- start:26 stop:460 length:435 start_codon:yes stop_codon:yes gene_type:complete